MISVSARANVDLPRTMNDAQPYLIFERRAIEQSGATSVEGFLRQRLPMDATEAPMRIPAARLAYHNPCHPPPRDVRGGALAFVTAQWQHRVKGPGDCACACHLGECVRCREVEAAQLREGALRCRGGRGRRVGAFRGQRVEEMEDSGVAGPSAVAASGGTTSKPPLARGSTPLPAASGSSTQTPTTARWSSGNSTSTRCGTPGCTPATTIPSHDGSSADRAGGSRSIGPSGCTSTVECPVSSRPLRRGTIDDIDGMPTAGSGTPGTFGIDTLGSGTLGMETLGIDTFGMGTLGSDIDGSGTVDNGDVAFALLDYGVCPGCPSDLDGSGEVDFGDIALILLSTGPCQ
jgi:hypothetical protein